MSKKQTFTSEEMLFTLREHLKENSKLLKEELTANRKAFVNNQELEHAI